MSAPFRKRLTLFEQINRAELEGDEYIFQLMEELTAEQEGLINFRPSSMSTQSQQDRVLQIYKNFVRVFFKKFTDTSSDDEVIDVCFPVDHRVLYKQLQFFMTFAAKNTAGRASASERLSYRAYTKYRSALIFWCGWFYNRRDLPNPNKAKLFNSITVAMQSAANHWKLTHTGIVNRTHVGLAELRQMIDYDMANTPCIELAESHHLAWCMGRIAAIRPGSIGPPRSGKAKEEGLFVKWSDVVITRGEEKGMFDVVINFRGLKTNTQRNYEKAATSSRQQGALKVNIKSPRQVDNILFSVPHRLLTIAIRREALVNITTIEELLDGVHHFITIKPEFLDKPIMLASGPRGLSVRYDAPVMSGDLTDYLQLRGKKVGFESPITWYSIRRRTATELAKAFGPAKARMLMAHDADSRVLEEYYMDHSSETAISAAMLHESIDQETSRMSAMNAPLAMYKLDRGAVKRTHGAALNALVRKQVMADSEFPRGASESEWKNYLRSQSRVAYNTLLSQEVQKQRETLTKIQLDERLQALEHSKIMDQVLGMAKAKLRAAREKPEDGSSSTHDAHIDSLLNESGMFDEEQAAHEEDIDQQLILGCLASSTATVTVRWSRSQLTDCNGKPIP